MKKSLVLSGFWARGNTGDEAMLQSLHTYFSNDYVIINSFDHHGAIEGWWNLHPYNINENVHESNRGVIDSDKIAGLHIGGGGLDISFCGTQLLHSIFLGKPVFMSGVDFPNLFGLAEQRGMAGIDLIKKNISIISFRTKWSYDRYSMLASNGHLGADWAWDLPCEIQNHKFEKKTATFVIREECCSSLASEGKNGAIDLLIQKFEKLGFNIVILPFSPEDVREFKKFSTPHRIQKIIECWWNPAAVKGVIAQSDIVISIGRYHPLIFATSLNIPIIHIEIPLLPTQLKITSTCKDLSVPNLNISEAISFTTNAIRTAVDMAKTDRSFYTDRFNDMKFRITRHIALSN